MTAQGVSIRFFLPAPALRAAISTYYVLRIGGDAPVEDLLHPEWANIRLLLEGDWGITFAGGRETLTPAPAALISGVLSRTAVARGAPGRMVGVGLMPAGWAQLTELPASDYADTIVPLATFAGAAADDLAARLHTIADDDALIAALDRWFVDRLTAHPPPEPRLVEAHKALLDPEVTSVAEWARRVGRSTRQLERMTLTYFGLSPKALLRRQRFLRTFAAIREHPPGLWGRMIDPAYADQPQFVREFRHFMGMTPSAYFARDFPFMRAAGEARKALLGSPVQGLHAPAVAPEG